MGSRLSLHTLKVWKSTSNGNSSSTLLPYGIVVTPSYLINRLGTVLPAIQIYWTLGSLSQLLRLPIISLSGCNP